MDLVSDGKGEANVTGFQGWYDITVEKGGATKTVNLKYVMSGERTTVKLP